MVHHVTSSCDFSSNFFTPRPPLSSTVNGMASFSDVNRYENVNVTDEGDWGSDDQNDSPPKGPPPAAPQASRHARRPKYMAPNRAPGPGSNRGNTTAQDYVRYTFSTFKNYRVNMVSNPPPCPHHTGIPTGYPIMTDHQHVLLACCDH